MASPSGVKRSRENVDEDSNSNKSDEEETCIGPSLAESSKPPKKKGKLERIMSFYEKVSKHER